VVGKIILLALDAVDGKRVRGEHLAVVAELADAALAGFGTDFKDIRHAARAGIAARVADAVDRDADFLAVARKSRAPRPGERKVGAFALRREEARGVGGRGEGEDLDEGGGAHDVCFHFLFKGGFCAFGGCECCVVNGEDLLTCLCVGTALGDADTTTLFIPFLLLSSQPSTS